MDIAGSELVVLSAADDEALSQEVARVLGYIDRVRDVSLPDVAYTCSLMIGPARLAIIATSIWIASLLLSFSFFMERYLLDNVTAYTQTVLL